MILHTQKSRYLMSPSFTQMMQRDITERRKPATVSSFLLNYSYKYRSIYMFSLTYFFPSPAQIQAVQKTVLEVSWVAFSLSQQLWAAHTSHWVHAEQKPPQANTPAPLAWPGTSWGSLLLLMLMPPNGALLQLLSPRPFCLKCHKYCCKMRRDDKHEGKAMPSSYVFNSTPSSCFSLLIS